MQARNDERRPRKPKVTATVPMDVEEYDAVRDYAAKLQRPIAWVMREGVKRMMAEAA